MPIDNETNTHVDEEKVILTDSEQKENPETDAQAETPNMPEEAAEQVSGEVDQNKEEKQEGENDAKPSEDPTPALESENQEESTEESVPEKVTEEVEQAVSEDGAELDAVEEEEIEESDTSADTKVEESQAEEDKGEGQAEEETEVEDAEGTEDPEVSQEAAPAEKETSEEEQVLQIDESLQPLLDEIDTALAAKDTLVIEGANPEDLTRLLLEFGKQDDIRDLFPRVGMIKRSFDAINVENISEDAKLGFTTALEAFNTRRKDFEQQQEVSKAHNSERKKELIAKLKEIVDAGDTSKYNEVRAIQDEWKTIGYVKREDVENLQKTYRHMLDNFYRQRETHFELLEYDRKKNLTEKENLILEAEQLVPAEEEQKNPEIWSASMNKFKDLQKRWRATGHVPREDMERINTAYRSAIDKFFEVRQGFMDDLDKLREVNGEKKREILEQMASFSTFEADKPKAWNDATRQLREHQDAWKQIGQGPIKINNELWSRYREICNAFFTRKSEFFKKFDELRSENLTKKRELCEKAEELKDSTSWEKAAKELKQLQRDWKSIGPVPERYSNKLWNRFRAACDAFFEARRSHYSELHADEHENLEKKKALIEQVKQIDVDEAGSIDEAIQLIKNLQASWKEIGKVPFKEKDKIWEEFRAEIDKFFNGLSGHRGQRRRERMHESFDSMKDTSKRASGIRGRIQRMRRKIHAAQEKVDQYSTNIQFISKGKSGDALRAQIQGEIDKEIAAIAEMKKDLKELNEMLKNPPKEEVETPKEETAEAAADVATEETAKAQEEAKEEKAESVEETATEETPKAEAKEEETVAEAAVEEETEAAATASEEVEAETTEEVAEASVEAETSEEETEEVATASEEKVEAETTEEVAEASVEAKTSEEETEEVATASEEKVEAETTEEVAEASVEAKTSEEEVPAEVAASEEEKQES